MGEVGCEFMATLNPGDTVCGDYVFRVATDDTITIDDSDPDHVKVTVRTPVLVFDWTPTIDRFGAP